MISSAGVENFSLILTIILTVLVISNLNQAVKDFFLSNFIVFSILLFAMYLRNKNLLVSFAGAFVATIVIAIITMPDPMGSFQEHFELIFPNTDSKLEFNEIKAQDLVAKFGSEEELLIAMKDSDTPENLQLNDSNAPVIATYLSNNNRLQK